MIRKSQLTLSLSMALALASQAFAGGFYLNLGTASASSEAKAQNAVLTVRVTGCNDAAKASVIGSAEGLIDGRRQSISLKLIPLSEPGMYAVQRQWATEGRWVLNFVANEGEASTAAIVPVGPTGAIEKNGAKYFPRRAPASSEIEAALRPGGSLQAAK